MAFEGTLKSIDPLAYLVNNVSDLDEKVVIAHKNKDTATIAKMTGQGETSFHIFICINKSWHAFVLCVPYDEEIEDPMGVFSNMPKDDPYAIPGEILSWVFELCYEREELKTYKIRKEVCLFRDVKDRVKRAYYVGKYRNVKHHALQFAALRAAPHRYNVLLNDCVEFAKEFCICMLSYCNNYRELEKDVNERISKATTSGLSAEHLSRRVKSSALFGNTFLGGMDGTYFLGNRFPVIWIVLFLLYPIVTSCIVAVLVVYFMQMKG
ncbi:hypothetical protein ACJMK2_038509 [Sinanodonta woodiana]|uniref:LRAT domain-containing protein n=1 Tax=Sinanodonta woodiana TaxID=1069815 RepID=A0ABD3W966_SINWO